MLAAQEAKFGAALFGTNIECTTSYLRKYSYSNAVAGSRTSGVHLDCGCT